MTVNTWYPAGKDLLGTAGVDLETATLAILLMDTTYVFDPADVTVADVTGGQLGTATDIAGTRTLTGGVLTTDTVFTTLHAVSPGSSNGTAILVFVNGASDSLRLLLGVIVKQSDTTPINIAPDGTDITVTFPTGTILRI